MNKIYKNRLIEISAFILIIIVFIHIVTNSIFLYEKIENLKTMKEINFFSNIISEILHKTQEERGAGAGYLGKPSEKFRKLYLKKIEETDKIVNKFYKKNELFCKFSTPVVKIYLGKLKKIRKGVLNNKISLNKEIDFYSKMDSYLLDNMGKVILKSNMIEVIKSFYAYKNFEMAKEKTGEERAVLSGIFSQNRWNKNLYILYVNLLAEEKIFFKLSIEFTNKNIKNKFDNLRNNKIFQKIEQIEKIALNKNDNFGIDSLNFYNLITDKINQLNKIVLEMSKFNNKIIDKSQYLLLKEFLYQFFIDALLVVFLFYTLFLFHKEQKKLYSKSTKDKLTNLYNREFLFEIFPKLKKRVNKNNTKLALFFMDLDGFKGINDSYGHDAGDIVLVETAKRLKNIFRKSDVIVRLGGDEFIILAECENYNNLKIIATKIINEVSKAIALESGELVKVGVSIGISVYPDDSNDMEELIKKADEAMYFSKKSGKGIYTFYN